MGLCGLQAGGIMATTGQLFPASGSSVDRGGATDWVNPGNITGSAGSDATSDPTPTDYLLGTTFSAAVPSGAVIDGVTVRVSATESGPGTTDFVAQLISDGTPTLIGSSKGPTALGSNPHVLGGSSDVWGATLSDTIVNASGFGIAIWSTDADGDNELQIDYVTIEIHYTLGDGYDPSGSPGEGDFFLVL